MPLMQFYGVPATARASFGMYNTVEEVDVFIDALLKARDMF
jgi:cysteine desulfurase/selenocysteine lyase